MTASDSQFLLDYLRPTPLPQPVVTPTDAYLKQGLQVGESLSRLVQNGQSIQNTRLRLEQEAAQNPYNIALLQAKTAQIPLQADYLRQKNAAELGILGSRQRLLDTQVANAGNGGSKQYEAGTYGITSTDEILGMAGIGKPEDAAPVDDGSIPGYSPATPTQADNSQARTALATQLGISAPGVYDTSYIPPQ